MKKLIFLSVLVPWYASLHGSEVADQATKIANGSLPVAAVSDIGPDCLLAIQLEAARQRYAALTLDPHCCPEKLKEACTEKKLLEKAYAIYQEVFGVHKK